MWTITSVVSFFTKACTTSFPGLQVRPWNDRQKTCMLTITSLETSSRSLRARRCSRLRKMWRRTMYLMSEITVGRRDRQVSNHNSNTPWELAYWILSDFFLGPFVLLVTMFFYLSYPETDLLYAAKVYRDDRMRKKAELMTMDNCRELDRLNNLFRGGWVGTILDQVNVYE